MAQFPKSGGGSSVEVDPVAVARLDALDLTFSTDVERAAAVAALQAADAALTARLDALDLTFSTDAERNAAISTLQASVNANAAAIAAKKNAGTVIPFKVGAASSVTFVGNNGAAPISFGNSTTQAQARLDLSGASKARVGSWVTVGQANCSLAAMYSTDDGATYAPLVTPGLVLDSTGLRASAWTSIPEAAKAEVIVWFVGFNQGGSNVTATIGLTYLEVR